MAKISGSQNFQKTITIGKKNVFLMFKNGYKKKETRPLLESVIFRNNKHAFFTNSKPIPISFFVGKLSEGMPF